MVKLTIVGRVSDGLPLAQGPRYMNEENTNMLFYKQQAEIILKEISRGALPLSKMSIRIDHHFFNYLVENEICYTTLCESSYPRKLVFHYLQDLQREIEKVDKKIVETIIRPYSFIKIDNIIGNIRKHYIDTRSQANLSRLNAQSPYIKDIVTEDISKITENKGKAESMERVLLSTHPASSIWCSPFLEAIALRWTPITILLVVATIVLWVNFVAKSSESFVVP